jgi:hypothetical protein
MEGGAHGGGRLNSVERALKRLFRGQTGPSDGEEK